MKIKVSFPLLSVLILTIAISINGYTQKTQRKQNTSNAGKPSGNFATSLPRYLAISWKQADSLASLGQPQSALAIVNKIYTQAKAENNDPQVIKAIIYRIRLNSDFQENFMTLTISGLQKEIAASTFPRKQLLQSILAEVYWKFYQNNQYRFRNRTQVKSNLSDSIETWDLATLSTMITRTYLLSLENRDSLQRIPVGKYDAILEQEIFNEVKKDSNLAEAARFTPTLYDFLAGRALEYFASGEVAAHTLPAQRFEVDQPWFFSQSFPFVVNRMMIPADTAAPASFAMRIYRDLAGFHLKDKDPRALIETELKRLAFVHEHYILPGKDSLYPDALRKFEQAQEGSPWSTSISYVLAGFLNSQGEQYQPLISELHKWDIRAALEVCDKASLKFPGAEGSKNCRILAGSIKEPFLQVTTESAVPADKPSLALISVKNQKQLFFRLVKINPEEYAEKAGTLDPAGYLRYFTSLPAARSWSQNIPDDGDYQKHQAEMPVPAVPAGFWVLLGSSDKNFSDSKQAFSYTPFWSSQISYVSKRNADGSYSWFLLDRTTGLPLKNFRAEAWEKNYNYQERKYRNVKLHDFTSDEQGYILVPPSDNTRHNSNQYLKIYGKDDFLITENFYQYPVFKGEDQTTIQTLFYTDRGIYRPGQIVYFKGIILSKTGDRSVIKPNHATKVVLTDANGQKVSELSLTSNEFGSVHGTFTTPVGVLPGQMTLSSESGSTSFSVEEYKRPTFDVSCEPLEGNYKLGELLTVTGKALAFAGNPIDAARVSYRVMRTARFPFPDWGWRWPMPASPQIEIASGTTVTDAQGKFTIPFTALPDGSIDKKSGPVFDFSVSAEVTDLNGETQSVEQIVSVGYKALIVEANIPEMVNLDKDTLIKIATTNLNGRPTPAMVSVTLQKLRQPDRAYKTRMWSRPDLQLMTREEFHAQFPYDVYASEDDPATWAIEETLFETGINTLSDSLLNLHAAKTRISKPGSYLVTFKATDPFGEVVEVKKVFTAFSPVSKEVPVNVLSWFVPLKTAGEPGETARFLIGSKEDNINLIYEIRMNDSLVSREWIKMSDRAMVVDIPIREQYRGNFSVNFMFVKHNRVFQESSVVSVPYTNKKLDIAFETFRDKLDPGSKERWKIKISGAKGKPAMAEFMAGMYDASLDLFRPNEWTFNLFQRYSGIYPWETDKAFRTASGQWHSQNEPAEGYSVHPGLKLNWFGTSYFEGNGRNYRYARGGMDKSMRPAMMDGQPTEVLASGIPSPPEVMMEKEADPAGLSAKGESPVKTKPDPAVQVRRNFNETAFFYPVLHTDSTGSVLLEFTAPESLTKWKLQGLAHTKNLEYGLTVKELVTRKDLMVFPNAPRFVRQGDTVIFSTKIVNLADRDLTGEATLLLTDAIALQPLDKLIIPPSKLAFTAMKGQSTAVSWKLAIPVSTELAALQYRITAVSGSFSDGEEKAIPVLTNRMLVTESLSLPIRGKGTVAFSFDKLLKSETPDQPNATLKNYKLTLEFASNPAWYAIQALPSLNDRQYENADAIFAAFWSNSLASWIANSNPKIKAVFESWKSLTPDALQSNLAKNQDLKSALLQETPWVMEANSETDRKQKLGRYFDEDNIRQNLRENLGKLQKLQTPGGGWTWFAGMPENRYITQNILTGLGQLNHIGVTSMQNVPAVKEMVLKAIGFLDGELVKDYENLKRYQPKNMEGNHIGSTQIQYLYARSYFMNNPAFLIPDPGSQFAEAFGYYTKQASAYWLQNDRYLQGMIALALNRMGSREVPALILKSFSEKALHSKEMGMYWAGERGYFWYQAPVETQALMIEAFDEISQDKNTVEELKIWLLKQKQTQDWRSSQATLQACYALLLRGTDLLADDPGIKISLGREKISSDKLTDVKKEAGTGYFRQSWSGSEIKPEMGNITVSKSGDGVSWGAVYWQYFENLDKITPAAIPMHLEKKLFVETLTDAGPVLEEMSNEQSGMSNRGAASGLPVYPFTRLLKPGDKIVVRIVLTVDRDLEYVHMKDMRGSGLEPANVASGSRDYSWGGSGGSLSGYRYQDGLGYYQSTTDQATNFFFDYLPKGTYVFEYALKVNARGDYSNGITTIQCMYAPEFTAHSEGIRIRVE